MPKVEIEVYANTHGAKKELEETAEGLSKIDKNAKEADNKLSGLWKQFALGQLAADVLRKGFQELTQFVSGSIKAAAEAEAVDKELEAALVSTGRTVEALLPSFKKLASEIQRETTYSDEAVKSAQTLLLQLTNLDRRGIEAATRGAVGLSSVLKIDLQSAAMLVAKAMEGNTEALSRYGIKVQSNLPLEEKRNQLLQQLSVFYERAKAETNTFAGAQAQLKNAFDDLKEVVGETITKNEGLINLIKNLKEKIEKLTESNDFKLWLSALSEAMGKLFETAEKLIGSIAKIGQFIGEQISHPFKSGKKATEELEESFRKLEEAKKRAQAAGHFLNEQTKILGETTQKTKEIINETGNVINRTGEESKEAAKKKKELEEKMKKAAEEAKKAEKNMYDLGEAIKKLKDDTDKSVKSLWDMQWALVKSIDVKNFEDIQNAWFSSLDQIASRYKQGQEEIRNVTKETNDTIKHYFDGLFNDIAKGLGNLIEKWLEGGLTLKNFMKGIWEEIKESFFRMVGEMVSSAIINQFKSLFSSMGKSLVDSMSSAVSSVGKTVTSIAQGAAGAVSGIWMALGSAVGSFLGNLLSGGGWGTTEKHWVQQQLDIMKNIQSGWLPAFIIKLDEMKEILGNGINVALGYANALAEDRNNYLFQIADMASGIKEATYGMWSILKGMKTAQFGFEGIVTKPTLFMAGEAGPERVIVQPVNGGNSVSQSFVFNIYASEANITDVIRKKIIPELSRLMKSEGFLIHPRAVRAS